MVRVWGLACGLAVVGLLVGCGGGGKSSQRERSRESLTGLAGPIPHCSDGTRPPLCYAPEAFRTAYGTARLIAHGIDGRGRTVVILDRGAPPSDSTTTNINQDVSLYDRKFGLPAARLSVNKRFASSFSPALAIPEEVLDVEMVHTNAPAAAIRVMFINAGNTFSELASNGISALGYAVSHDLGDVISISASFGEHCFTGAEVSALHDQLRAARARHITVFGSSGDYGAVGKPCGAPATFTPLKEVGLPASDPLVTAAGGTRLAADPRSGAYRGDTAWNRPPVPGAPANSEDAHSDASGGGFSRLFGRPSYQDSIAGIGSMRGIPDVAADADSATGLELVSNVSGKPLMHPANGTSASAPLWAAIALLADQYTHRRLGFLDSGLYRIGNSSHYREAFHDITTGNNTVIFPPNTVVGYQAKPGWDPVTGLGSPDAQTLVPLLAKYVHPADGQGL